MRFKTTKEPIKCVNNFSVIDGSGILLMMSGDTRPPSLVSRIYAVEHTNSAAYFNKESVVPGNSIAAFREDMVNIKKQSGTPFLPLSVVFLLSCFL